MYCDITLSLQGDELWSFCGLLQGDHSQIHMKWIINYNTDCNKHLAFVIDDEKMWVHRGAQIEGLNCWSHKQRLELWYNL
jgi:hypothetical protein